MEEYKILAMNFGSTSTKVAAYEGDTQLLQKVFHHSPEDPRASAAWRTTPPCASP